MKIFIAAFCLFSGTQLQAQIITGKTGIIDYGNPSYLYAPAGSTIDLSLMRPEATEVAFSNDGEHFYVKNPDTYIYKRGEKQETLTGWSLVSEQKEDYDVSRLPFTRSGRAILALFTPQRPLHAYSSNKNGRSGWDTERWISADLKLKLRDTYSVSITDTGGKQVASFKLPDFFYDFKPERMKQEKIKPKDYDIDMTFAYYPADSKLFISADCGRYARGYNRLWMYSIDSNKLSEIPFFTTHDWDSGGNFNSIGKTEIAFRGKYIVRKFFTEFRKMQYEFIAAATGLLAGKGTIEGPAYEGQDNRVLAFLPGKDQVIVFNHNQENDAEKRKYRIDYYDITLTSLVKSVELDLGNIDLPAGADRFPIAVSNDGKFVAFSGIFKHPEVGSYLSVNFDLLEDANRGYLRSINDKTIHAPMITESYAAADFKREQEKQKQRLAAIEKLKAYMEQSLGFIKKHNDELLGLYNQNQLDELLERAYIWTMDRASFRWTLPAPEGVLNGPTPYSFGVDYEVKFTKSVVSVNYVNMMCRELVEARKDYLLANMEEHVYGESYFKPSAGSHTLIRNPNYRWGPSFLTFDKPQLAVFLGYLEKSTELFNGNSFEVTTKNQLGIPLVVLKFYYHNDQKAPLYLYQHEILRWLQDYNNDQKALKKLMEER